MLKISNLPRNFCLLLITLYQKTISPDHGFFSFLFPHGYCRFHPSCSQYSKEALEKYGFWKGLGRSFYRVARCNPWGRGGVDEV